MTKASRDKPCGVAQAKPSLPQQSQAQHMARTRQAQRIFKGNATEPRVVDDADVLTELCRRLVDLRVVFPYYLHQLDRVRGAAHFEVSEAIGHGLIAELRRRLPGYAVPRYVREVDGESHKVVVSG